MSVNATFEEAFSITFGGLTSICFLERDKISEKGKPKYLIIGGTDSIAVPATQIGQYYGVNAPVKISSKREYFVENLGVPKIIYFDKEDFRRQTLMFDNIFDAVGETIKKQ